MSEVADYYGHDEDYDPMTDDTREAANTLRALADARDADLAALDEALNAALADARYWEEQLVTVSKRVGELEKELADLAEVCVTNAKLRRLPCPVCGKQVLVNVSGYYRSHWMPGTNQDCAGSRTRVEVE